MGCGASFHSQRGNARALIACTPLLSVANHKYLLQHLSRELVDVVLASQGKTEQERLLYLTELAEGLRKVTPKVYMIPTKERRRSELETGGDMLALELAWERGAQRVEEIKAEEKATQERSQLIRTFRAKLAS